MNLEPLKDRIVVKRTELAEIVRDSGLIVTKDLQERPQDGTVLAIGPEVKDVKVGDKIMFGKQDGTIVAIEGTDAIIMRESQVWGILHV